MEPRFIAHDGQTAVVRVQLDLYGLDPLLAAAHKFTGRCFVHLEQEAAGVILCRIRAKQSVEDPGAIAGDFCNEVLDQTLRARLRASTEPVRSLLLAQAFSRTNLISPELDSSDPIVDPAGIASPDDPHS
jgi:His-Xaa-Ser system protein HxsD